MSAKLSALTFGTSPTLIYGEEGGTSKKYSGDGFLNVMNYGAKGDGVTNDTAAIRAAIVAMQNWTSPNGSNVQAATVYFPPGIYLVQNLGTDATDAAVFEIANTRTGGRIIGAGKTATRIQGFCSNNMIFNQPFGNNGITELSHMTITNSSTVIGSGAVRLMGNPDAILCQDLSLTGMMCLELGYFAATAINIDTTGSGTGLTPNYGGIGINLIGGNVIGWDTSSGGQQYGLMTAGNTGSAILGCRAEETVVGMAIGFRAATATLCTISGGVLTITGASHVYPDVSTGIPGFTATNQIVANGIPATSFVTIASQLSSTEPGGALGGRGTYSLSGAGGITISSPSPVQVYQILNTESTLVAGFETEGCGTGLYLVNAQGCTIMDCNFTANGLSEAATIYGSNTATAQSHVLLYRATSTTILNCQANGNVAIADWMFEQNVDNPSFTGLVIDNCQSAFTGNTITTTAAFIDDGSTFPNPSGVAGKVLSIPTGALAGGGDHQQLSIRGLISGAGIPGGANSPYIDSKVGLPSGTFVPPPSGGGGLDNTKYLLNAPGGNMNITGVAITCTHGKAWGMQDFRARTPISGMASTNKASIRFRNNDYVNDSSLGMLFADLPDALFGGVNLQALIPGLEYTITDCATPIPGAIASGGGSFTVNVKFDGSHWIVMGGSSIPASCTFATLPASPVIGMRTFVTNSNASTFGATINGTGSNGVPAVYNGTSWIVG